MRIATLLPSATEIVYALGLGSQIVAVTHECDFPPEATTKTSITRDLFAGERTSGAIDRAVREGQRDAHTIYSLDSDRLVALAPDVILTQSLCEVCAVPRSAVEEAVCSMPRGADVISLDPHSIEEMLQSILAVGERLAVLDRAQALVGALELRIADVERGTAAAAGRPRVFCCEWLDPIFCGGHWVPEQVRRAGGADGLAEEGAYSKVIAWEDVVRYQPEVVVLMPCGFDAAQAAKRLDEISKRPGWDDLPAVQRGRVFAVDGSAYFSRPGPRLVDGLELLARVFHPEVFSKEAPAGAALRLVTDGRNGYRALPYR